MTKCDQFRTMLVEEAPDIAAITYINQFYLITEGVLALYLLLCIMYEDNTEYSRTDPAFKVKIFFFACNLPFVILRVIILICCRSPKTVLV